MAEKDVRYEGKLDTIIGKGSRVEGSLVVEGSTRIDGSLTGKLISNDMVTIGTTGEVKADIKAKSIIVGGKVHGNLEATDKIELQTKAEFKGDLIAKSLLIEHGALFHGSSRMLNEAIPGKEAVPSPATQSKQPQENK